MQRIKFTLKRHHINAQGYDARGHYYGVGQPLYWYGAEQAIIRADDKTTYYPDGFIRASGREAAKRKVREMFPKIAITFWR